MASRCELCGRFRPADQPHIHFDAAVEAERPFAAAQVDKELADRKARRSLGSATIPDSGELSDHFAEYADESLKIAREMHPDPRVRRRWPWRKRR